MHATEDATMPITAEQAAVFRGGGRRWFTLRAAARAEAKALINKHCHCDYCDHDEWGVREHLPCRRHQDENFEPLVRKLAARYMRHFKAQQESTP